MMLNIFLRILPSHHGEIYVMRSEFIYTVVRQFSSGGERISEVILVPDSLGKGAFLIGVFTSRGNLKGH